MRFLDVPPTRGPWPATLLAVGGALALLAGCGGSDAAATASAGSVTPSADAVRQVQGRVGQLVLGDGYVREPASPDVAAAYLTIVNEGDSAARLTAVRSDVTARVMPMTETSSGGVGNMSPLDDVVVPAHSIFRFRPGAAHLMLEQPHPAPAAGDTVSLTLTFTPGGAVTVALPVVPIGATGPASVTAGG